MEQRSPTYNEEQYLNLMRYVRENGTGKDDRTGTGTISSFGHMIKMDLRDGSIPIVTTKKLHIPAVITENLWYFQGTGNISYLKDNKVRIWNEWANEKDELGPVYGVQWRKWPGESVFVYYGEEVPTNATKVLNSSFLGRTFATEIDQVANAVELLKTKPTSRRILVTAWNPTVLPDEGLEPKQNPDLGKQALPPCHYGFQLYAKELTTEERAARLQLLGDLWKLDADKLVLAPKYLDPAAQDQWIKDHPISGSLEEFLDSVDVPRYELSLLLTQRSCDYFLGGAFNILSYSLILRMFCEVVNMFPGDFVWSLGDVHLYNNHLEQVDLQLTREPFAAPKLRFDRKIKDIDDFHYEDFIIEGYQHHPPIKATVAV